MRLLRRLRNIKKSLSKYQPSVEILISRDNLIHNLQTYKKKYPALSFAPVLKSNAYGHGLKEVAQVLDKQDIPFFVADSLYEAMLLRQEGIKSKILVIGYTSAENINSGKLRSVDYTIMSLEQLQEIERNLTKEKNFHLKIDTGMHRQGILFRQINTALQILKASKYINLVGICSHLANADSIDQNFTKLQIDKWNKVAKIFKHSFPNIQYYHLTASAGTVYSNLPDNNIVRLGIGLYGINPSPLVSINLKPVLRAKSVISSVKTIQAGEFVGYNITYQTKKITKVATVPVGYFEGVDRRLSNLGSFKIGNNDCPIIGRVSMNITTIDVTDVPDVNLGDKVTIISDDKQDVNSVENIAKMTNTIPYEILIHIPQHLRRTIIA